MPSLADIPHGTTFQTATTTRAISDLGGRATTMAIAEYLKSSGISLRHTGYGLADGGAVGGLVVKEGPDWKLTDLGSKLAATEPGSAKEGEVLREAMLSNPFIASVVSGPEIATEQLAQIVRAVGFSETSVARRVSCLRAWRRWFQSGGPINRNIRVRPEAIKPAEHIIRSTDPA